MDNPLHWHLRRFPQHLWKATRFAVHSSFRLISKSQEPRMPIGSCSIQKRWDLESAALNWFSLDEGAFMNKTRQWFEHQIDYNIKLLTLHLPFTSKGSHRLMQNIHTISHSVRVHGRCPLWSLPEAFQWSRPLGFGLGGLRGLGRWESRFSCLHGKWSR